MTEENIFERIVIDADTAINGSVITLGITVNCLTPIIDSDGNEIAVFVLEFDIKETVVLTPGVSLTLRDLGDGKALMTSYNIGLRAKITEDARVGFSFDYSGASTLDALKNDFQSELGLAASNGKPVYERIRETLESSAYGSCLDTEISFFRNSAPIELGCFGMDIDLRFALSLDARAALEYSSHTEQYLEIGVRSSSAGPQYYERHSASASCSDLMISGEADVAIGICADVAFALNGLKGLMDAGFSARIGSYSEIAGCADIGRGNAAAYLELGTYRRLDHAYSILDSYKAFTDPTEQKSAAFTFGYKSAILGYKNSSDLESGAEINIINKETDISSLPLLTLTVLDIAKMSTSEARLDPSSDAYTVQIKFADDGYLSYSNGNIKVSDTAPAFFKENITVSVKPSSAKWSKYEDGRVYADIAEITVTVVFGDEDAYYDSVDTNIQKQFRRIYRSYNKANADVLRGGFEELIESFVEIPDDISAIYHDFVAEYMDQLFDLIEEYRSLEDEKRTMENKFVASEADIFDSAIPLIYDLIDGKYTEDDGKDRIYTLLEQADDTVALYNTLIAVQDSEALKSRLANIGDEAKARIEQEISAYETAAREDGEYTEKTESLIRAVRNLFSITAQDPDTV